MNLTPKISILCTPRSSGQTGGLLSSHEALEGLWVELAG